jgi:1-deoxy-D-xylulose-5-phosphate reductoisomerase
MKKKIIILGSTGSIGTNTVNIIKKNHRNFSVVLLSTNKNIKKVYNQAKVLGVKNIVVTDKIYYNKAKKIYKKKNIRFHNTFQIIDKLFKKKEIFYSMVSIVGLAGLDPSLRLIKYCRNIAIVNKESLICAWNLISEELKKYKTRFLPIDSEHYSIYSLLDNNNTETIEKIYITASGGPFLNFSKKKLSKIKTIDALNHPTWKMGKKISIDSSTMMNKLFEVIEAKKIFNLPYKKIEILIHPNSYIHAVVKFNHGIIKFLAHQPDMIIPISNSIFRPSDLKIKTNKINLKILNNLNLQTINYKKFPLLKLLRILPKKDTLFETVIVSVNDFFVSIYLKNLINFKELIYLINYHINKKIFQKFKTKIPKNIDDVYQTKNFVYTKLENWSI